LNQNELIRNVKSKNRVSNLLIALKVVFALTPQLLIIHMVACCFAGNLNVNIAVKDGSLMLLSFIIKAFCS
jgi:ATP-binding cassette subfamily B protein IrtA